MLTVSEARERAMRRAVETGELADMQFIHAIQSSEGVAPCFGRMTGPCDRVTCRWHKQCMALLEVREVAGEPVFA